MKKQLLLLTLATASLGALAQDASQTWQTISPARYDFNFLEQNHFDNYHYFESAFHLQLKNGSAWNLYGEKWHDDYGVMIYTSNNARGPEAFIGNNALNVMQMGDVVGGAFGYIGTAAYKNVTAALEKCGLKHDMPVTADWAPFWGLEIPLTSSTNSTVQHGDQVRVTFIYNVYGNTADVDLLNTRPTIRTDKNFDIVVDDLSINTSDCTGPIDGSDGSSSIADGEWNPEKWVKWETTFTYDKYAAPYRFKIQFKNGTQNKNTAFFIKEIKAERLVSGSLYAPARESRATGSVTRSNVYYAVNNNIVSGINDAVTESDVEMSVNGNVATFATGAEVYGIDGRKIAAVAPGNSVTLPAGVYIATGSGKSTKFTVK